MEQLNLINFFREDKSGKKKKFIYMSEHYPKLTDNILEWSKQHSLYGLPFDELTYLYSHLMFEIPKDDLGYKRFKGWSKGYSKLGKYKDIQDKMIVDNLTDFLHSLSRVDYNKQSSGGYISQTIMNNYMLMSEINSLFGDNIDVRHKIVMILEGYDVVPKCSICGKDSIPRKTHGEFRKTCSERCRRILESDFRNYVIEIDGKKIILQGYERFVIHDLLLKYDINDIIFGFDNLPIYYEYLGRGYNYYPDFYIVSENKIIEVKSSYTFDYDKERNLAKKFACIKQGYDFEFNIWDLKKII